MISTILAVGSMILAVLVPYLAMRKLKRFEKLADTVEELFQVQYAEDGEPMIPEKTAVFLKALSGSLASSLKMSVLGALSGPARLEKGLKKAFTEDMIDSKMPILNLLDGIVGTNVKEYITKNPDSLAQLLQWAGPLLQGTQQGGSSGSNFANNPYRK